MRSMQALVLSLIWMCMGASIVEAQSAWNSVTVTWTAPGDDSLSGTATQYDIRYSTAPISAANFGVATRVTGAPAPAVAGTTQSMLVSGLQQNTTYWFAMKTVDDASNWSGISNIVQHTTATAPDIARPAPLALTIAATTDSTVTLAWTAVGDDSLTGTASGYDIRWSTQPVTAANWATASQASNEPAPGSPGTAQSFVVRGLSRQTTYYFAARAFDDSGNISALSNVPSATTPDSVRPAAVSNLSVGLVWIQLSIAGVDASRRGTRR